MGEMLTFLAALPLLAWLYLLLFRGSFWRSSAELDEHATEASAKVAVVVPARDEASCIQQSIGSLLGQIYPDDLSVILVDDNSTDGTAELARTLDGDGRLFLVRGKPLPPGWSGKLWAVHQGLAHSRCHEADYILLTDADIVHAPHHVWTLVAKAESDALDLVSEMVHLHCETAAEKVLIPAFVFFFQMLYPFAWVADPRKSLAGAAGGTMLVKGGALKRVEGVQRIRHQLIDDCALAGQIKSSGGHIWLGHTQNARSIRVYRNWRDVWDMIARTAYVQLRHSPSLLLACVAGMSILYIAPPVMTVFLNRPAQFLGASAWVLLAFAFQPTLRRYRRSPLWGVMLPLIAAFYLAATLGSALRYYNGRGGGWKNRVYPEPIQ